MKVRESPVVRKEEREIAAGQESFIFRFKQTEDGGITVEVHTSHESTDPVYIAKGILLKRNLTFQDCHFLNPLYMYSGLGKASVRFAHSILGENVKKITIEKITNRFLKESLKEMGYVEDEYPDALTKKMKSVPEPESLGKLIVPLEGRLQYLIETIRKQAEEAGLISRIKAKTPGQILQKWKANQEIKPEDFGYNESLATEWFLKKIKNPELHPDPFDKALLIMNHLNKKESRTGKIYK